MKIFWPKGPSVERKGTKHLYHLVKINVDKKETNNIYCFLETLITLCGITCLYERDFSADITFRVQNSCRVLLRILNGL